MQDDINVGAYVVRKRSTNALHQKNDSFIQDPYTEEHHGDRKQTVFIEFQQGFRHGDSQDFIASNKSS